jgi:hypothetical protein
MPRGKHRARRLLDLRPYVTAFKQDGLLEITFDESAGPSPDSIACWDIGVWAHDSWSSLDLYKRLGYEHEAVRIGSIHYNTVEEVDRLVDGLRSAGIATDPPQRPAVVAPPDPFLAAVFARRPPPSAPDPAIEPHPHPLPRRRFDPRAPPALTHSLTHSRVIPRQAGHAGARRPLGVEQLQPATSSPVRPARCRDGRPRRRPRRRGAALALHRARHSQRDRLQPLLLTVGLGINRCSASRGSHMPRRSRAA